jgi:hypothetical protein
MINKLINEEIAIKNIVCVVVRLLRKKISRYQQQDKNAHLGLIIL